MMALLFRRGETGECVCSFFVLLWYMLDDDFVKLGNRVVDRVVITLEEGFFYLEFTLYLTDNQLRVALAYNFPCS